MAGGVRLIAVDAVCGGDGPGVTKVKHPRRLRRPGPCSRNHVGEPVHLVGFSWGGATGLHVTATTPETFASVTVVEPEACSLLKAEHEPAFAEIGELCDRWRSHVRADRWYEAFEEFVDLYNGPGSFARGQRTDVRYSLTINAHEETFGTCSSMRR